MTDSILVLAIVVLPGWLSVAANRFYYARILDPSTTMIWGMMLYHATMVHIVGVISVTILTMLFPSYFLSNLNLDAVLVYGPSKFITESPTAGFVIFGTYTLWIVAGSIVSGVSDAPSLLIRILGSFLRKVKLAPERFEEEPIWHRAFTTDRERIKKSAVQVRIRMKNEDIYVGNLHFYPILPDSENSKDFRLGKFVYYKKGDITSPEELESHDNEGGVLLNTENVSSIEYLYIDQE